MEVASELCQKSDVKLFHHGAVLVRGNKIIATGFNHYVSDSLRFLTTNNSSIHAEQDAIYKALIKKERIDNCILYVVRVNNNGTYRNSQPCNHCKSKIMSHKIRTIYYSIS